MYGAEKVWWQLNREGINRPVGPSSACCRWEIGMRLGVGQGTIRRVVLEAGWTIRPPAAGPLRWQPKSVRSKCLLVRDAAPSLQRDRLSSASPSHGTVAVLLLCRVVAAGCSGVLVGQCAVAVAVGLPGLGVRELQSRPCVIDAQADALDQAEVVADLDDGLDAQVRAMSAALGPGTKASLRDADVL